MKEAEIWIKINKNKTYFLNEFYQIINNIHIFIIELNIFF